MVAGHSLGARIAAEVALQLAPSKIEVQMVLLIDDGYVNCCFGAGPSFSLSFSLFFLSLPHLSRSQTDLSTSITLCHSLPLSATLCHSLPLSATDTATAANRPSFGPHRFADTWDEASPVARIERFFAGWFASCTASCFGQLPQLIQSDRYDEVADLLQACDRSELHPSFETVATGGWKTNASFWDRAWRLARFAKRVSAGSLLSHRPTQDTKVPVLLVRTDATNRVQFLKGIAATCRVPSDHEALDFGASAVFRGMVDVAVVPGFDHMAITTAGARSTATLVAAKLAALQLERCGSPMQQNHPQAPNEARGRGRPINRNTCAIRSHTPNPTTKPSAG